MSQWGDQFAGQLCIEAMHLRHVALGHAPFIHTEWQNEDGVGHVNWIKYVVSKQIEVRRKQQWSYQLPKTVDLLHGHWHAAWNQINLFN